MKSCAIAVAAFVIVMACHKDDEEEFNPPPPPPPPASAPALMLQPIASIDLPMLVTAPPGDARLFIVEKHGTIRIYRNGALLPQPFLDISSLVSISNEQGLLGLAFHPDYATNGVFVINFTNTEGDTRLVSYRVSANPDIADASSAQQLLAIDQPETNHNGGNVVFGPGGKLYVSSGDGGGEGDTFHNGQSRDDLFGSLFRLNILANGTMTIPADNPFVAVSGARGELWDYGLRNPWRFSFDRANGDLYLSDVGQNEREEINILTAASGGGKGLNYGWPVMEGSVCFEADECSTGGMTRPQVEYPHAQGCSIIGGFVYRGTAIPELQGTYFYGDYCDEWVRSLKFSGGNVTEQYTWSGLAPGSSLFSFGEDAAGELYICARGNVFKIVRAP